MFLLNLLRPKNLLKFIWFSFGAFGLFMVGQKYWPKIKNTDLIKGVQSGLVQSQDADFSSQSTAQPINLKDLTQLDPQQASQAISQVIKEEITKILETTTTEIKQFPASQIKKIKIGACENLLEEDICSIAKELQCQ